MPSPKKPRKPKGSGTPSRPASAAASSTALRKRPITTLALAVVIVGTLVLGLLAAVGGGGAGGGNDGQQGPGDGAEQSVQPLPEDHPALALARRDADDPLALGDPDAPVVMLEYADFQCAFCGIYARDTRPQLLEEYVDEGVLRVEFRNFPVYGPESDTAARASWAAGEQGRFWEFYDAVFAEEFHRDSGRLAEDGAVRLAEQAGVPDLERFRADLESEEAGEAVARDAEEAYELGVTTTPAFLINGHPLVGSQPADAFRELIDALH